MHRFLHISLLSAALSLPGTVLGQSYDEGIDAYSEGDYTTAVEIFRLLSEQGNKDAQYNLGVMYVDGQGVPQSEDKAAELFRQVAEQGHPAAQFNLGTMYHHGDGVPQDYSQAAEWYRRAAVQGIEQAQLNLAFLYKEGQGVNENPVMAYILYTLSANQGIKKAHGLRNDILQQLTREQANEGKRLSSEWRVGTPLPTSQDVTTWP